MPAVSVIIPVFNVEKYIERCVRSLMEQTLDDIEFIFVNDATEDDSMAILQSTVNEYPHRVNQVKYVTHDVNKGLPTARHTGLLEATGDYIIHCDSDDFVDRDMYRQMYEKAKEGDYDMVVCDFFEGNETKWKQRKGKKNDSSDLVSDIMLLIVPAVWNKLVKSGIAHDSSIVCPFENMGEDLALTVQYALMSSSVGYIHQPLYYYVRHITSITGNRSIDGIIRKTNQLIANFKIVVDAIERHGMTEKYKNAIIHGKVGIKNQLLPLMQYNNYTKLWRETYRDINLKALFSLSLTRKEKVHFIVTWLGFYPLYCKIKHSFELYKKAFTTH